MFGSMDRNNNNTAYSVGGHGPRDGKRTDGNHVFATGIGVFVICVAISAWAFPTVRDLSLFESVYVWICAPFIG